MKTITCDICGKEIKYYNFDPVIKMKVKVNYVDFEKPTFHLCEDCYGDVIKFMNGITNELVRKGKG